MIPTYLYVLNDVWFDVEKLIEDTNGEFYWLKRPKRSSINDRVYIYLSGGTKAVKYEALIIDSNFTWENIDFDFSKYYIDSKRPINKKIPNDMQMIKLKVVREIKNLDKTSPKSLKENGNILGSLMSNRELKPFSIKWLDSIK